MFTYATAITRLTSGPQNCFAAGLSGAQQLQRVNEVLERFYEFGEWRGLQDKIVPVSSGGIITLSSAYQRLDALGEPLQFAVIPIKPQQWAFSTAGPSPQDWTNYGYVVAIDMGDVSGVRKYQLTGNAAENDARILSGLARKRYTWVSDTATVMYPDCYQALRIGVLALGMEDEGANTEADAMFSRALTVLNGNLQEFEPEERQVVMQHGFSGATIRSLI